MMKNAVGMALLSAMLGASVALASCGDEDAQDPSGSGGGGSSSSGLGDGGEHPPPKPVDIATSAAHVRVTVPLAGVFRVRLSQSDTFPQVPSFAVDPAAVSSSADFTVDTSDDAVIIHSGSSALRVTRNPLTLALLDGSGNVVAEEAAPVAWADQTGGATVSWKLGATEHVYGLGDKANGMDRRGKSFKMWNTDHYQWSPSGANADPLYKSIPDFLFLSEAGVAHGLFIDNPSRSTVDVGNTDSSVFTYAAERTGIKGTPSTVDLYVMAGPDPRTVITSYTALTGRTPLPPRWSLGYNQSRYSYASEAETREVASRLRADSIPTDVIWLDLKYLQNNAPFTIDYDKFPNFSGMISDFSANGLNTVLIVDPHIRAKEGEPPYDTAIAGDHVVKNPDGTPLLGGVWPFRDVTPPYRSIFPEFTLASARKWWGTLFSTVSSYGVAGIWNDMNEPSIPFDSDKFPEGTMHDTTPHRLDDGTTADHVLIHNAYGLLNARATYEGEMALRPNTRPFVLSRAAYAGSQKWGTTWTGDNSATREHLAVTIPQLINLGVSGYANAGADVGGYSFCPYGTVDASLYTEWMDLGALQPFFRNHSENGTCRREPWVLGDAVEARVRKAIERRYRLLPYLYTAFEEASRNGLPVMRPLWLEYPSDKSTLTNERAYLLGRDLLIAPKLVAGSAAYTVTLPQGGWWDTLTGDLNASGGDVSITPPADDSIRIFARAGAIIPSQPLTQTAGAAPQGALTVDVWPGADCSGSLYLDDGSTLNYQKGDLLRVAYACQQTATGVSVTSSGKGSFSPWWTSTRLVIHGASKPTSVKNPSGSDLPWSYDGVAHTVTISFDGSKTDWSAAATWGADLTVSPTTVTLDEGATAALPATTRPVTWAVTAGSSNCAIVNGQIKGLAVTTTDCTLTATAIGDTSKTGTVTVKVTPYVFTVSASDTDLTVVKSGPFSFTLNQDDPLRLVATRPAIWTVSGGCLIDGSAMTSAIVTALNVGSCQVTATSALHAKMAQAFTVTVVDRPKSNFVDLFDFPKNVYMKGDFPSYQMGVWNGNYEDMMRLKADYTWSFTWNFTAADLATPPRMFKFVADQGSWPAEQMFTFIPGHDYGNGLAGGPLLNQKQIADQGYVGDPPPLQFTLSQAGIYTITFHEPTTVGGTDASYTVEGPK